MVPLLIVSVLMWFFILSKSLLFLRARRSEKRLRQCWEALQQQKYIGAFWQQDILRRFDWLKERSSLDREPLLQFQRTQETRIERHIQTILILAGAAPLLGLLGTVNGMITTFDVISVFGTGNARAMAAGISEALITTQVGLVVAVPGLLIGAILQRRSDNIKERMQRFRLRLLQQSSITREGSL